MGNPLPSGLKLASQGLTENQEKYEFCVFFRDKASKILVVLLLARFEGGSSDLSSNPPAPRSRIKRLLVSSQVELPVRIFLQMNFFLIFWCLQTFTFQYFCILKTFTFSGKKVAR